MALDQAMELVALADAVTAAPEAPEPPRKEVAVPQFENVPPRAGRHSTFLTYLRPMEATEPAFEGFAFRLGCTVGLQKLAQFQAFPVANSIAVNPAGGPSVILLLRTVRDVDFTHAKLAVQNLMSPAMAGTDMAVSEMLLGERLRPVAIFRKDMLLEQFDEGDYHPEFLAYQWPAYAVGPYPRNNQLEAYIPGRVVEEDLHQIVNSQLPPVVDHRAAPLVQKILFEGAEKLWLPKLGSQQQLLQKIELVIERKTGAKITREDRREMLKLVANRKRKVCRTCEVQFWPEHDEQVDCDLLCFFAAVCSCGQRLRPERNGRRVHLMALQEQMCPVQCSCGELAFTSRRPAMLRLCGLVCPI
jgi:hypothetical protein